MPQLETAIGRIKDPVARLLAFMRERVAVRIRKEAGTPVDATADGARPVWTDDPILREYRFCNVRREDDRVTRWIADNWRTPHADDPDLWFAMVVARFINWPGTLSFIGYPVPWDPAWFLAKMAVLKKEKKKLYTGAYMVRGGVQKGQKDKFTYQEQEVFTPMWEARERLRPKAGDTLNLYHMLIGQFHGLGSFMAAQVVADLKYVSPLKEASDWFTFAASGPGSRRGLNFVLGRPMNSPWTEENWRAELGCLHETVIDAFEDTGFTEIHAQDMQNNLCEFYKYEKTRLGLGRPRAMYRSRI